MEEDREEGNKDSQLVKIHLKSIGSNFLMNGRG